MIPSTAAVVPSVLPIPLVAWNHHCRARGDAVSWQQGCRSLLPNPGSLSQLGQHPVDSGDPAGPGAADTQGNRQQQRETADAEHQCWLPVPENPHPTHGWGEAQQGEQDAHTGPTPWSWGYLGVNSVMELSPGEISQQEWVCIPSPVSWSGLGVCDSPQCPGSRVTCSWVRSEPRCRGVRRQQGG